MLIKKYHEGQSDEHFYADKTNEKIEKIPLLGDHQR